MYGLDRSARRACVWCLPLALLAGCPDEVEPAADGAVDAAVDAGPDSAIDAAIDGGAAADPPAPPEWIAAVLMPPGLETGITACPPATEPDRWAVSPVLPAADDVPELADPLAWVDDPADTDGGPPELYCRYTWIGEGAPPAGEPPRPAGDDPLILELVQLEQEDLIVAALQQRPAVLGDLLAARHDFALLQLEAVRPLPTGDAPGPVRVAVLDSALPGQTAGRPGTGRMLHGRDVGLLVRELTCPDNAAADCPVSVETFLALDLAIDAGGDLVRPADGGYFGRPGRLATTVAVALIEWLRARRAQPDLKLVINLSVGWEPRQPLTIGERSVRAALRLATCLGAVVVAAAGNDVNGAAPSTGPMLPGGFESVAARRGAACAGGPGAPLRPLVHAAGGLDGKRRPIASTRPGGRPQLAAYALEVAADDGYLSAGGVARYDSDALTGSSMAAAAVSAAAALVWRYRPALSAAEVLPAVYEAADGVPGAGPEAPAADFCQEPPCPAIRRVTIGRTLAGLGLAFTAPPPAPAEDPDVAAPLQGAVEAAATVTVDLAAATAERPVDAGCLRPGEPSYPIVLPPDAPLPEVQCPERLYLNDLVSPVVNPQPGETGCGVCQALFGQRKAYLFVNEKLGGRLHSVWLKLLDNGRPVAAFYVGPGPYAPGSVLTVTGIDPTRYGFDAATVSSYLIGYDGSRRSLTDQLPIK